jgi:hypothetical protein
MRIGIDLDNTIVCYDASFHRVATEMGLLGGAVAATKGEVKAWVLNRHGNAIWTELQGEVYGSRLETATPHPGALEFVRQCRAAGHNVCIVSHKTQFPAIGRRVDLRAAAFDWLAAHGWFDAGTVERVDVEFHDSRAGKVAAIARRDCEIFIDDLPEVFLEPGFPSRVTRILFDPEKAVTDSGRYLKMGSWAEITRAVLFFETKINAGRETSRPLGDLAAELLRLAGLPAPRAILPLPGGRNNKVFCVSTSAGDVLLKSYFHSLQDSRDRLAREFDFLNHLARTGSQYVARPLASLPREHAALMEFIDGVRPSLAEVDAACIDQAIAFFFEANREIDHPLALVIEPASEACFAIAQHLACAENRITRLDHMVREDEIDAEAADFVRDELLPAWREVRGAIEKAWPTEEIRQAPLPQAERCLSPSDFGFHNSLRQEDGGLRFLDFEYAGWDDPAKLIADFANQPDMLLERALSDRFRSAVIAAHPNPDSLARRVAALEPLYQIKWACICLNDFLEFGRARLQFTEGSGADKKTRRKFQLARARQMLGRVSATLPP